MGGGFAGRGICITTCCRRVAGCAAAPVSDVMTTVGLLFSAGILQAPEVSRPAASPHWPSQAVAFILVNDDVTKVVSRSEGRPFRCLSKTTKMTTHASQGLE